MKYDESILNIILKELEEFPNIRRAVKKAGIDHSTYYRWRIMHKEFREKTNMSISIGRANGGEILEGVLFNKAQQGDLGSIKYWLSHNNRKYMHPDRLLVKEISQSKKSNKKFDMLPTPTEGIEEETEFFEMWFEEMYQLEIEFDYEQAGMAMNYWLQLIWKRYPQLQKAFHVSYRAWKENKIETNALRRLRERMQNGETGSFENIDKAYEEFFAEENLPTDDSLDSQGGLRHQSEDGDV